MKTKKIIINKKIKKMLIIFTVLIGIILIIVSCINVQKNKKNKIEELKLINDLSVIKIYCHNIAEIKKEAGSGITHLGEVDRKQWIEYSGIARLGMNLDNMKIEHKFNKIVIHAPKINVLSFDKADYTKNSYITSKDGWFNKNQISREEENKAMEFSKEKMKEDLLNNKDIIKTSRKNIQITINSFIRRFEKKKKIEWIFEE